jgi:hypothetical protein
MWGSHCYTEGRGQHVAAHLERDDGSSDEDGVDEVMSLLEKSVVIGRPRLWPPIFLPGSDNIRP